MRPLRDTLSLAQFAAVPVPPPPPYSDFPTMLLWDWHQSEQHAHHLAGTGPVYLVAMKWSQAIKNKFERQVATDFKWQAHPNALIELQHGQLLTVAQLFVLMMAKELQIIVVISAFC